MPYAPIQLGGKTARTGVIGTMPVKGTNKRDLPQFLDPNSAQYIENYLIFGQGKTKKRGGSTLDSDTSSSDPQTLRKEYRNNLEITAYGTTVKAYDRSTGSFTSIKTDFTASNGGFDGERYGDYFYVTNKLDGLWRISRTITYSQYQNLAGTNVFTITNSGGSIGATITGGTSLQTANVVSSSGTTTLTVVVSGLSGNFTHGEPITSGTLAGALLTNINPFTVGKTVTGATSGAKGLILEHTDNGSTGTLTIGEISGTFQNTELLADDNSNPGRGTATSTLGFTITSVSAPKARYCKVIGNRLLVYQLATNAAGWAYSDADDGSNPPFGDWTVGSGFNDPGDGYYRNGVTANTADMIGNIIFIGYQKGWIAFSIDATEIDGVSSKIDTIVQTSSSTGVQKVKMTEVGLIACGELGVKRLVSLGQPDTPYSEQWETLTEQLGEDFFDDADFTNADIDYNNDWGYIFVTYAKDSPSNNFVLAIKAQPPGVDATVYDGATTFITGWTVNNFLRIGSDLYGTSATDGKTYKLFDGETDEGSAIYCQYLQEINFGSLSESFDLGEFYAAGNLTSASTITVTFDRYTRTQRFDERVRDYTWTKTNSYPSGNSGWGEAAYGSSGYGGSVVGGLVEDFTGANVKLRSNMRVLVRFEANDYSDHTLSWFSIVGTVTTPIRRRTLLLNS